MGALFEHRRQPEFLADKAELKSCSMQALSHSPLLGIGLPNREFGRNTNTLVDTVLVQP